MGCCTTSVLWSEACSASDRELGNSPGSCGRKSSMKQVFALPLTLAGSYESSWLLATAWSLTRNNFSSFRLFPREVGPHVMEQAQCSASWRCQPAEGLRWKRQSRPISPPVLWQQHHHPEPHHTSASERQTGPKAFLELFHKNKTHFLNGGGSAKMAPLIAICPHKEGISHQHTLI